MLVELSIAAASVWVLGMIFQVLISLKEIRTFADMEENLRTKDVKNYYRLRARNAVHDLKWSPLWPITVLDIRKSYNAVKKYRELNPSKRPSRK